MSSGRDPIPLKDAEFDAHYGNACQYVKAQTSGVVPRWGHIPPERVSDLLQGFSDWHAAYEHTIGPHTVVDTQRKAALRITEKRRLRDFFNAYLLHHPSVTAQDWILLGRRLPEKHRLVPVPATAPQLSLDTSTIRCLVIRFRDSGSTRRGKPPKVHGIEVRWAILDQPPAGIEDLVHSAFNTRSPLTLQFTEADRGKKVYLAGAWEIEREGLKGPFSVIIEAFIP